MIKSILIPTDGSAFSGVALEYGIYLAEKFGAKITGLHVVDARELEGPLLSDMAGSLGFSPYQNYLAKFRKILEGKGDVILEAFRSSCEERSIRTNVKRFSGVVANVISDEAKKADLVIIAQRGQHERWSSGLLGSTTESVVRKSPRPVLVTPNTFREFENVLVAYDGSVESNKALKTTLELFAYSETRLKSVVITHDEKRCEALTEEIEAFVSPYQVDVDIECLEGEPSREILRYAGDKRIDLIVMGAFGHSRLHDLVLGGTTAYIIRNATLPVLLNR
ncbi:MAG: universal stress protein [Thermodesulfobacteriota bacterium]